MDSLMRILANIWHLIGRLYQPAAWRIFPTKRFKPSSSESADRGRSIIQVRMHSSKKSVKLEIVNRYDLWVLRHKIGGAKVFVNNVQWRIRWCNAVCNTHIRIETTKHEIKLKWIITIIWTLKHIDFYFKVGK
jgi:hypothetical protein